jgi:hypothetical protein
MTRGANQSGTLVKDLQGQVKKLEADLRARSDEPTDTWGQQLRTEYETARQRNRTGFTWSEWRDGEVALAAVAWVLATVFIRFSEDNDLLDGPWITGPGVRNGQAADNETAFFSREPTANQRDWLKQGFEALASLPAGRALVDRHNLVWRAPISADAASVLLAFWRKQDANGSLIHDFTDPDLDTRFLGDLYQDLSEFAKKKYALLQTPDFIEEFILDRTLTPAINEFGLKDLKLIDPTCGSGHFLLGAFQRLNQQWQTQAPNEDSRVRVQKALDSIHGVDLNPFAVAIARFRLTVVALRASGITRLKDAPAYRINLATGDSLLYMESGRQGDLLELVQDDGAAAFTYANEDVAEHPHILDRGTYHVVVGNPPYITVKDKALNELYRAAYKTCKGKYALSVPFMELFFELAKKGDSTTSAGYVGQITSNSFMKREFGSKIIESLLSGKDLANPVDLSSVIDTSGAYIPGHSTPTVILFGRRRKPLLETVRTVMGVRSEPGHPDDPAQGLVWTEIVGHLDDHSYDGNYVTITDLDRTTLQTHPWSLSGGGAGDLKDAIEGDRPILSGVIESTGFGAITGDDDVFVRNVRTGVLRQSPALSRLFVEGEKVRDFTVSGEAVALFPYPVDAAQTCETVYWPFRTNLRNGLAFNKTREQRGMWWGEYILPNWPRLDADMLLVFASVATHNHFVLDRGGKVFKQSAPVIKLPAGASEEEYLDLLGVLNSSTACFWLKQVSFCKGNATASSGMPDQPWSWNWDFTGTKLQEFPLPLVLPRERARHLNDLAHRAALSVPNEILRTEVSGGLLVQARESWAARRAQMVFQQEELDWEVYRLYVLVEESLTYQGTDIEQILPGQRAFEIALAREVEEAHESTKWFSHHGHAKATAIPDEWPEKYRTLVQRRLDLIASDPFIGLLERPEFKRRWAGQTWEQMEEAALREFVLDKLETPELWSDASGPGVLSVAQLADRVRGDADLVEAVRLLRDAVEVDLTKELGKLLADEAVPYLPALRYKDSGLRKRAEWESVWDLQRREDAGERVQIPVPPKYQPVDFRKTSYWQARGKLDVPKERFISYPNAGRAGDSSLVLGWAGWDHLDQARALARLIVERAGEEGWSGEQLLPLIAGLVELEPWLHQWFEEPSASFGGSPAGFITGFIDQQLSAIEKTRVDCKAWRP